MSEKWHVWNTVRPVDRFRLLRPAGPTVDMARASDCGAHLDRIARL